MPSRKAEKLPSGNYLVTVTPPDWSGFKASTIELSPDQYKRYKIWLVKRSMVQETFPELTASQREILLSGIGPKEWDEKLNFYKKRRSTNAV